MIVRETGPVVYSASDLTAASVCEWALMRKLDARLGRIAEPPDVDDAMLLRAGELGDRHEQRVLAELRQTKQVVEIARPTLDGIETAAAETLAALRAGTEVVFQAAFFDGRLLGYADFIVRCDDGRYEVYDTKLARKAKITALLQLAAYSDQLMRLGFELGERVHLWLGDGETSSHRLSDILPVYRKRRARLQHIIDERVDERLDERVGADAATPWGDPRYTACGRCPTCSEQVSLHRDVLLVAGLTLTQRSRLRAAGVVSIDDLAARERPVEGMPESTLDGLRLQARMQLEPTTRERPVAYAVVHPPALAALPAPSPGDLFFDFEGDPLHQEAGVWGLDYLFGVVEAHGVFRAFWAHDLQGERRALVEFLQYVRERRAEHPDLHIYHYASYERTHLLLLAARHGVGEEQIDDLLRANVLVDLYPVVRQGLRIGSRSYSLKKLEPLYMGAHTRTGTATATDSVAEYVRYTELAAAGETRAAAAVLDDIARYNEYDCLSTLRLRDWLRGLIPAAPTSTAPAAASALVATAERPPDPVYVALAAQVAGVDPALRTADQTAIALASAAIDYHRREDKSFWWEHFDRLKAPLDEWADTRDVFVIDSAEVARDWSVVGSARNASRELIVSGQAAPGSRFSGSTSPFVLFDPPYPALPEPPGGRHPGARVAHERVTFTERADGRFSLVERLATGAASYDEFPLAVTPASPPKTDKVRAAIAEWGAMVLAQLPGMAENAALDLLRRRPPRLATPQTAPLQTDAAQPARPALHRGPDPVRAIVDSLLELDRSYIAVQGPPGTGKTYTGARVIRELVEQHGWKVGVVAQSHATVENMLEGIIDAGLPAALVGKKPKAESTAGASATPAASGAPAATAATAAYTVLTDKNTAPFVQQTGGMVYGGTQWNFANSDAVARESLDLLVIDEAGQFSLAATIAASVSARRMLLLGDPQQLPQVSQGTHPEPVDESALAWLTAGHQVLPPEFGYFLEATRRMAPELCAAVSRLSYEGLLHSAAPERELEGVEAGLHAVPIIHSGDSTSSAAEAGAVVDLVERMLGRSFTNQGATRPLAERDVIVVAPYNAQVQLVREYLGAAGLHGVRVGTVDTFQGQEAVIAIVSLAASAADDVPRGLEFLLLANRLNVAISRAQWAAFVIYSPALTEHLPNSIAGLAQLSAFITLVEGAHTARTSFV